MKQLPRYLITNLTDLSDRVNLKDKLPSLWPLFPSLQGYNRGLLNKDIQAALAITAVTAPQALGFAIIVGLPVVTGLYCALLAPLVFAAFTSSRRLIVGPDTATATILAAGAAAVAIPGTSDHVHIVAVITVLTGLILIAMSLARFGWLADLISYPVLTGFLTGIGLQLLVGKLPQMLNLPAQAGFFDKLSYIASHIGQINLPTAILSVSVVAFVVFVGKFTPRLPAILLGLVAATAAVSLFGLQSHGVQLIGQAATGLPGFALPAMHFGELERLFATALSIAVVVVAQSTATIRSYAAKHDEEVDDNQDLLALGVANVASAATFGFAVTGSPSRTAIVEKAGGRTQMVNILMAVFIGICIIAASSLLRIIPIAALAAIVFTIGLILISPRELMDIYRARRMEFCIAMVAMAGVALLGIEQGVLLAVVISIADRLRRQYRPHDQVLLQDTELSPWASEILGEDTDPIPGVLVYRFSESIFFENTTYFISRLKEVLADANKPVKWVIVQADAINDIDYTAAKAIGRLMEQLNADDIRLVFSHVTPELHATMDRCGLSELIGENNIHSTLHSAMDAFPGRRVSCIELVKALDLPTDSYVVVGAGVLEALGIRDTNDVDLVVNEHEYQRLHEAGWREYIHDDGKKVLHHGTYEAMVQWLGYDLDDLRRDCLMIDDVAFINLKMLTKCKVILGRKKDLADIKLIQAHNPQTN